MGDYYVGYSQHGIFVEYLGSILFYSNNANLIGQQVPLIAADATCLLQGTRITCEVGDKAVEDLAIGDLVALTDGTHAKIRWIGRQTHAARFADSRALPIRVAAGALGESIPARDLHLSADHALLIDGALVQAGALMNGTTIARMDRNELDERFVYFHIELDTHAAILAEGAPCESFVANVSRDRFDNFAEYQALFGEERHVEEMHCPRIKSARQLPASLRNLISIGVAA